jgi:C4-dicarboxylate-specific signal transduction histidine kinase
MVADRNIRRLKGEPVPQIYDFRLIGKDGDIRWGELNAVPISWEDRPAVLCFMDDITERKKAEESLQAEKNKLQSLIDAMEDSITIQDTELNIIYQNETSRMAFGDHLMEKCYRIYAGREKICGGCPVKKSFKDGKSYTVEISKVMPSGEVTFWENTSNPLRNAEGKVVSCLEIARNITTRKKIQEQLVLTDRLASIGQLAAGMAHELNNPLTGVIGFSELLLGKDLPEDVKEDLVTIDKEARRAANVVKGLLTFTRDQGAEKTLLDINNIIQRVLQLRSYEQKASNIEVETRFAADLPKVTGNIAQLQHVFLNIIINAEQAMIGAHGGGKLTITTERVGDIVRISIADDGPGISPDNMKKLFTPFFTTRGVGKGTGLGLSICHGIVTEHGGKIYADSKLGKGATFVVELHVR